LLCLPAARLHRALQLHRARPSGPGESDKPAGPYSTEVYADQVAAFLGAIGVEQAHVAGVSLGAGVGVHLAARQPGRVRSLSLHSARGVSLHRSRA
jgi:pimeloyl-ACP methyl ester carboxylesterase